MTTPKDIIKVLKTLDQNTPLTRPASLVFEDKTVFVKPSQYDQPIIDTVSTISAIDVDNWLVEYERKLNKEAYLFYRLYLQEEGAVIMDLFELPYDSTPEDPKVQSLIIPVKNGQILPTEDWFKESKIEEQIEVLESKLEMIEEDIEKEEQDIILRRDVIRASQKRIKELELTKEKIKKEGLKKTRLVYAGDFILSNSMSFGRPYIVKITGAIHDGWLLLRMKNSEIIDQDYLYEILRSDLIKEQYEKLATGGVVRNLNSNLVSSVEIPLPPIAVQREIVSRIVEMQNDIETLQESIEDKKKEIKESISEVWGVKQEENLSIAAEHQTSYGK